ncbi:hypothetical protein [Butyrivibrio sp. INlla16]|uniref:hypothetical protein n=1 Tax=Butyrivibrio sp. INlla16 TaxID=1520807 RepID=UPI0008890EE7|nr:hypothetical protein [Butyrivibrio sp. INlla16]SDB35004.1 hypothetical protein SAMN02910263_01695 [Butyrivibrio sp. INlla16]
MQNKTGTRFLNYLSCLMLSIIAAFIFLPAGKVYADGEELWVNGIQVSEANAENVLGDPHTPHDVIYSAGANTLYLNNNVEITQGHSMPFTDGSNKTIGIASSLSTLDIVGSATISGCDIGIGMMGNEAYRIEGTETGIVITLKS